MSPVMRAGEIKYAFEHSLTHEEYTSPAFIKDTLPKGTLSMAITLSVNGECAILVEIFAAESYCNFDSSR